MPAQRPRASFEPIPPNFDLRNLVEETPNFQYVDRISCDMIDQQGVENFDKLVLLHVVIGGKPLVIDGYETRLDPWTYSQKWLHDNHGKKVENARDLGKGTAMPLTIAHYLDSMAPLTDQYFDKPENYKEKARQRIYLKDIDCPAVWQDKLQEHIPPNLFYLNESTGEYGGPGSVDEPAPTGGKRKGRGVAPAGDLMSSLPNDMRAENLMCYIGHEGTYTPAHREMCASLGHNIMVETSDVLGDGGKAEKPGSSIWFMTESKDREAVSEYWLSMLGHDIEVETHFAQIAAWKRAPFTVYVVEQKAGDFILIPPLAPHQVWNRGTRTMKIAWNRTTVETLELAVKEALPRARMVCRDEQYKNKAIIYYSLQRYSTLLARVQDQQRTASNPQEAALLRSSPKIRQLQKDFKRLFNLFKGIMMSEMFSPETPHERNVQFNAFESNVTCAYCRGNIFNRFLTCQACENTLGTQEPEPYDVCMECYTMGRSCMCISKLRWAEQFKWKDLVSKYELWRRQYIEAEGGLKETSPLPLSDERSRIQKKTLAQVCQEQLKRRPFQDITAPEPEEEESDENEQIEMNDDGTVKKTKKQKKRSEAWLKKHHACHVCGHRHEKWKMVNCSCGRWWCYGTLFRGHDLMPQQIMEDPNWQCPHCKGICRAGNCRKDPRQTPYEPKATLLGHDTKKVADARSTESLVDFGISNLTWLKEGTGAPSATVRLQRFQDEADRAKLNDPALNEQYATEEADIDQENQIEYSPGFTGTDFNDSTIQATNGLIDPSLREDGRTGTQFTAAGSIHQNQSSNFVAPSAVMYQAPVQVEDDFEDIDDVHAADESSPLELGTKRKRLVGEAESRDIIRQLPKKKRVANLNDMQNLSGATKQYRKEQHRKALDEARRDGRFIQVSAAMRGKSRMVRLQVGKQNMLAVIARSKRNADDNVLVRSDIAPVKPLQASTNNGASTKPVKQVRIRVEQDDDFFQTSRKVRRNPDKGANAPQYEEFELGSDVEDVENDESQIDGAIVTTDEGNKKRRVSAWQANRHGEDSDDYEELPDDYQDGRKRNRRQSAPQAAAATGAGDDSDFDNHMSTAAAALSEADANLKAKMDAANLIEDEQEAEEAARTVVSTSTSKDGATSIMARRGPGGRKIKIVSKAKRRQTAN